MKKLISVLLAAIMLMSCFAVVSFAAQKAECGCEYGTHVPDQPCHCCLDCPNLDINYLAGCYNEQNHSFCCSDCTGFNGCTCGCGCGYCKEGNENLEDDNNTLDSVVTEQDKENFVDAFQGVLKKLSDFFNNLFDKIFEFLKIDGVLGKGDDPEANS